MGALLGLIPALPLLGFIILGVFGRRLKRSQVSLLGVGLAGISAVLGFVEAALLLSASNGGRALTVSFWTWLKVGGFQPAVAFRLDSLSLVFVLVVTFVGFLILLYSSEFMAGGEGYSRFMAWMNLFVGSMLILVLADNLLFLYLGWEGVGLCSYLLIGFWYRDPANGRAARKAFIMTRVGDTALAVGLFLLFSRLGTLDIQGVMHRAALDWTVGSPIAVAAAVLLLFGAVGKSAQLPLQTWLPDAMAGPTPMSALIHAATMVTAGVYLIARMNVIFDLAPGVRLAVAVIGAATLLVAGSSALAQSDIKRVLAYSTISQVGTMFLALGVGAWSAGIFHFVTHAFFKALLFLGAGIVIIALNGEHDIRKMGGLRRELPLVFWTFLIGAASLSALPLVTAGFYSKEWILRSAWSNSAGSPWLWAAGLVGAFLTSLYSFRLVFLVFLGRQKLRVSLKPGFKLKAPLVVLATLSIVAGFLQVPRPVGNVSFFSNILGGVLPVSRSLPERVAWEAGLGIASSLIVIGGLLLAYWLYVLRPARLTGPGTEALERKGYRFFLSGWGFDRLYGLAFVRPFLWIARINRDDFLDLPYQGLAGISRLSHGVLSKTQTGRLRWYAAAIIIGAIITLTVVVFL